MSWKSVFISMSLFPSFSIPGSRDKLCAAGIKERKERNNASHSSLIKPSLFTNNSRNRFFLELLLNCVFGTKCGLETR